MDGAQDVGYGIYDLFDLGEFDQKGSVATKYGTRAQLEAAIRAAQQAGLQVYLDTVLNHKGGADATEVTTGTPVSPDNRNIEIGPPREIEGWTQFTFPGRGATYSSFQWHWYHFDAIDYDQRTGQRSIFRLRDKMFATPVDPERGNFDYLMFADLDMSRDDVRDECKAWGEWIARTLGIDGFRLDAARHIRFPFFVEWLDQVRAKPTAGRCSPSASISPATSRPCAGSSSRPAGGCRCSTSRCSSACGIASRSNGVVDMRQIFDGTLVAQDPVLAVTFVDNHDT